MSAPRLAPEKVLESRRLVEELDAVVCQPPIVEAPRIDLAQHTSAHDRLEAQHAQKTELGEPAEEKPRLVRNVGEPVAGNLMVNVLLEREGHPDVDVRENR